MTTYTRKQIEDALDRAELFPDPVAKLAADLGLILEESKPEPGWYLTEDGEVALVKPNTHSGSLMLYLDGEVFLANRGWPALEPARVVTEAEYKQSREDWYGLAVERDEWKMAGETEAAEADRLRKGLPAAPVELTEDQVGALFDAEIARFAGWAGRWSDKASVYRRAVTAIVNAALAQHASPPRGIPGRPALEKAIQAGYEKGRSPSDRVRTITDAVIEAITDEVLQ